MRHSLSYKPQPRDVTPRRVAAATRALNRERAKAPLFADQIAEEQPTPQERIADKDQSSREHWQKMRDHQAQTWRKARRWLECMPKAQRERLVELWNASPAPADAGYCADFIRRKARELFGIDVDRMWHKLNSITWLLGETGYYVQHCGHPTANFPYMGYTPEGEPVIRKKYAFQLLEWAKSATEEHERTHRK